MRPGVRDFSTAYDRPPPPSEIRQEPLDGDSGHYARLCALEDGALPRPRDFGDYADDICYMETVQAELFAHLLPACLEAWRHDLRHNHRSDYAGNVEIFQSALARRPLLEACLTPARAAAVLEHYPVLWDHLMGQSGSFGQARRAGRDVGPPSPRWRASAATQPMSRSGPPKAGFFGPVAASRFSSDARHRISKRSEPRDKIIPVKWSHKTG